MRNIHAERHAERRRAFDRRLPPPPSRGMSTHPPAANCQRPTASGACRWSSHGISKPQSLLSRSAGARPGDAVPGAAGRQRGWHGCDHGAVAGAGRQPGGGAAGLPRRPHRRALRPGGPQVSRGEIESFHAAVCPRFHSQHCAARAECFGTRAQECAPAVLCCAGLAGVHSAVVFAVQVASHAMAAAKAGLTAGSSECRSRCRRQPQSRSGRPTRTAMAARTQPRRRRRPRPMQPRQLRQRPLCRCSLFACSSPNAHRFLLGRDTSCKWRQAVGIITGSHGLVSKLVHHTTAAVHVQCYRYASAGTNEPPRLPCTRISTCASAGTKYVSNTRITEAGCIIAAGGAGAGGTGAGVQFS